MAIDTLYPDIVFYGAPGVGKSTASAFVVKLGYVNVSFAGYHRGGLRDIVTRLGYDANDRLALNAIGMKLRDFDADIWIRPALAAIDRGHQSANVPVTIDDLRADNEWQTLTGRGFVRVHLIADDELRRQRLVQNGKLAGSTREENPFLYLLEDTERYHPDHVIVNNGTRDGLYAGITEILNIERRKRA